MKKRFQANITNGLRGLAVSILFLIGISFGVNAKPSTTPAKKYPCGMVVTSQHLATQVGYEVLRQGGNAIDAAVAVGYALSVVEPCCGNIGGGGFMLVHLANGQNSVLNFREKAPLHASASLYLDEHKQPIPERMMSGYLPVGVPGTVMGLNTASEKYGTLTLQAVIRPAIKLAKQGYVLVAGDIRLINDKLTDIQSQPNVAAIFSPHGKPLQAGDRLVQTNLSHTLETIASGGTKAFYQGTIAEKIVAASKKHGGILTKQDFLDYTVEWLSPIICHYRGYEVISAPPPSSGGITLCEMLNITSGYPLSVLGFHSPLGSHYILEAMRFAYADRNRYLGDPDFVHNPVDKLLSAEHTKAIRAQINPLKVGDSKQISGAQHSPHEKPETTHYSIVDQYGNAVSVTYTLNGFFGSQVIPGDLGFFLNNEMDDFSLTSASANEFQLVQGDNNSIQPGKRPLSSMTPTILLKDKHIFMVLGAPGGSTIPTQVLQTIENVIDYHFDIKHAVDAPRFHMQWMPDRVFIEPDTFIPATLQALKKMGYQFHIGSPFNVPHWGAVAAILATPDFNNLTGAIDMRRPQGGVMGCAKN
jgi:gamma-glutamyltranspeptidase/glutathione hydrolase